MRRLLVTLILSATFLASLGCGDSAPTTAPNNNAAPPGMKSPNPGTPGAPGTPSGPKGVQ